MIKELNYITYYSFYFGYVTQAQGKGSAISFAKSSFHFFTYS